MTSTEPLAAAPARPVRKSPLWAATLGGMAPVGTGLATADIGGMPIVLTGVAITRRDHPASMPRNDLPHALPNLAVLDQGGAPNHQRSIH